MNELWLKDGDAITVSYAFIIFIVYILIANKLLTRKENLVLILSGIMLASISLIEAIGWLTGTWEFAFDRTNGLEVLIEVMYAGLLFFSQSLLFMGIPYLLNKKGLISIKIPIVMFIVWIMLGWYLDVFIGGYTNAILVMILWLISATSYRIMFVMLYKTFIT